MLKLSELHLGLLTTVLSVALLVSAWNFPALPGQAYGAGTLPRLLGWCGILLGLVMIVRSLPTFRQELAVHMSEWTRSGRSIAGALSIIGVILFYILFSDAIGFLPAAIVCLALPMLVLGANPLIAIPVSIGMAVLVQYAFGSLLLVPLPRSPFLTFLG